MEHRYATSPTLAQTSARIVPGRMKAEEVPPRTRAGEGGRIEPVAWDQLFGGPALSAAERDALDAIARFAVVAAGQSVFSHLVSARELVALLDGEVALGIRTADGTFRTERIVRGLGWLDLSSAWLDELHSMDARASTTSTVVELPRAELTGCLRSHPGLALPLIQSLAQEVQALTANTHELMHKDAPARLAQWLAQRCKPVVGKDGEAVVQLRERKRDVASQLAITPETLSRLMRSFTRLGVIEVAGYTVRILDTQALGRLASA